MRKSEHTCGMISLNNIIQEVYVMNYFDKVRSRLDTNSVKWDGLNTLYGNPDLLAMWVADMDFDPAPAIQAAIKEVAENQVLGYTKPSKSFFDTYINWQKSRHDIDLTVNDILLSPSVVGSLGVLIQAFSKPGQAVLIHDPAYNGFTPIVLNNQRRLLRSPLKVIDGKFKMDLSDIENHFKSGQVKLFILSNPHNPGGRVWTKEELIGLADLCKKYQVLLVSDEIHSDLVYPGYSVTSAYLLNEKYFDNLIVLHSPTKTFNIAGTKVSTIIAKDNDLRKRIKEVQAYTAQDTINSFGLVAMEAAFGESNQWYNLLLDYLESNLQLIIDFFDKELPEVEYMVPESTYLFWFNAEQIGKSGVKLKKHFAEVGKVALVDGGAYGKSQPSWMRLNFGTSKERLQAGLWAIKEVFDGNKQN